MRTWIRRWRQEEDSNTLVLAILLMPLIIGAFGIGVDVTRNIYIRTELQNALDMATVAGAAAGVPKAASTVDLRTSENRQRVIRAVEQVYAANRRQAPGVDCVGPRTPIAGTSPPEVKCWREHAISIGQDNVYYRIEERSKNAFLGVLGEQLRYQTYQLESLGYVSQAGR